MVPPRLVGKIAWMASVSAAFSIGCSRGTKNGPIEDAASHLFGTQVVHVDVPEGGVSARIASCAGSKALVVSPKTEVELPIGRGVHTVTGRAALCGSGAPSRFEIVAESGGIRRSVLSFEIDAAARRNREAEPFAVTFWSDEPGSVRLLASDGAEDAAPGWLDVRVETRAAALGSVVAANGGTAPRSPGYRAQIQPLAPNERGGYWLTDWGWESSYSSWGPLEIDRANGTEAPDDGPPMSIRGLHFAHGVGVHAPSVISVFLGGACQLFRSHVGVDDAVAPGGSVGFQVHADGALLWENPRLTGRDKSIHISLDVRNRKWLRLSVNNADDGPERDWADWAEPELLCEGKRP